MRVNAEVGVFGIFPRGMMTYPLVKILVTIGSTASIGFGIWHIFVPKAWNWYFYIDPRATELIVAVRAYQCVLSLSLVLFGMLTLLFVYEGESNRCSIIGMLAATCILWLTRLVFQLIYPQGDHQPRSPIRDVIGVHRNKSMLHDFALPDGSAENHRIANGTSHGKQTVVKPVNSLLFA